MKHRQFVLLLFLLVLMAPFSSCTQESYDIYTSIDGFVYDEADNTPLEGVTVTITPGGKSMVTGGDGFFQFPSLDPQQYSLLAQKSGYESNKRTVTGVVGEPVHLIFMMKNVIEN